jgi:hypothetical protein
VNAVKKRPSVDPRVYELAESWLQEDPAATEDDMWDLAKDLQTACEDKSTEIAARPKPQET